MKNFSHLKVTQFLFLLLFVFGFGASTSGQEVKNYKNSIYGNIGSVIFSSQASLVYERSIFDKDAFKTNGRLMLGHYLHNSLDYDRGARRNENYAALSVVQLIYFVEINAGVALTSYTLAPGLGPFPFEPDQGEPVVEIDPDEVLFGPLFIGGIGLRFEKGNFMGRGGVGNLELLYIGLGYRF